PRARDAENLDGEHAWHRMHVRLRDRRAPGTRAHAAGGRPAGAAVRRRRDPARPERRARTRATRSLLEEEPGQSGNLGIPEESGDLVIWKSGDCRFPDLQMQEFPDLVASVY